MGIQRKVDVNVFRVTVERYALSLDDLSPMVKWKLNKVKDLNAEPVEPTLKIEIHILSYRNGQQFIFMGLQNFKLISNEGYNGFKLTFSYLFLDEMNHFKLLVMHRNSKEMTFMVDSIWHSILMFSADVGGRLPSIREEFQGSASSSKMYILL